MTTIVRIPAHDRAAYTARDCRTFSSEDSAAKHYDVGDLFLEVFEDCEEVEDVTATIEAIFLKERENSAGWGVENACHIAIESAHIRQSTGIAA